MNEADVHPSHVRVPGVEGCGAPRFLEYAIPVAWRRLTGPVGGPEIPPPPPEANVTDAADDAVSGLLERATRLAAFRQHQRHQPAIAGGAEMAGGHRHPGRGEVATSKLRYCEGVIVIDFVGGERDFASEVIDPRQPGGGPAGVDDSPLTAGDEAEVSRCQAAPDLGRVGVRTKRDVVADVRAAQGLDDRGNAKGHIGQRLVERAFHDEQPAVPRLPQDLEPQASQTLVARNRYCPRHRRAPGQPG